MKHILGIMCLLAPLSYTYGEVIGEDSTEFFDLGEDFTVITPSKMSQSLHDTPSAVSVITHTTIEQLGIRSVPEALRLVPGMIVTQRAGSYRINYHGNNRTPRRMQVLIDGMSIFRVGFAIVNWENLPVHINDIERIEVTRGPGGSTYGTNSFSAVVNIITKHPEDYQGNNINLYAGDIETRELSLKHAGEIGDTKYWMTLDTKQDSGFDTDDTGAEIRDDTEQDRFSFRASTNLTSKTTLDYAGGAIDSLLQTENIEAGQQTPGDNFVNDYFIRMNINHRINDRHDISINLDYVESNHKQEWLSCYPGIMWTDELRAMYTANPAYAATLLAGSIPSGGTAEDDALALAVLTTAASMGDTATNPACGTINQDFRDRKRSLEIIDRLVLSDSVRMTNGIGVNLVKFESKTYMNGSVENQRFFLYNNTEYSHSDSITVNLGLLAETENNYQDDRIYYSPRLSVNYHVNKTSTFRFGVSKGYRTPDLVERERDWAYTGVNMTPQIGSSPDSIFYITRSSVTNLVPEEIISKEIGFYSNNVKDGWFIDVRLFQEKLTKLISDPISLFVDQLSNDDELTLEGLEFQFDFQLLSNTKASLAYAYIDSETTSTFEEALYSEHTGYASLTTFLNNTDNVSLAYYAMSASAGAPFYRIDLNYNVSLYESSKTQAIATFTLRHLNDDLQFTTPGNAVVELNYNDQNHFFGGLKVMF